MNRSAVLVGIGVALGMLWLFGRSLQNAGYTTVTNTDGTQRLVPPGMEWVRGWDGKYVLLPRGSSV